MNPRQGKELAQSTQAMLPACIHTAMLHQQYNIHARCWASALQQCPSRHEASALSSPGKIGFLGMSSCE